jgi:hypothetical protein
MRSSFLNRLSRVGTRQAHRLALLCAVAVALLSPGAFAAAPMCDPSGASIVAPIPALPNATGNLTAPKACDDSVRNGVDAPHAGRHAPPVERVVDRPNRVVGAMFTLPSPKGTTLPPPDAIETPNLSAHRTSVYRPPRA